MKRHGLSRIVERKKADLEMDKRRRPLAGLKAQLGRALPVRDFKKALSRPGSIALIAELKRSSPSAGLLRVPYDVAQGARAYARGGASALSILTERNYFGGDLGDMAKAKKAAPLPVLRKDFVFDPYQVYEARAHGADAVLLIVALLQDWELTGLLRLVRQLGMTALVEVHDKEEAARAVNAGADVVGVNSRNLKDLSMDPKAFQRLVPLIPKDRVVVAESGLKDAKDVKALKRLNVSAVLVGESLLKQADLTQAARALVEAGQY